MKIYADNAATTPVCRAAINAMQTCLNQNYGNPSSIHEAGRLAADVVSSARRKIARIINAHADEIYFTSGGTEADYWAINIAAEIGAKKNKRHIISTAFEHPAVLKSLDRLKKRGFEITLLPVHGDGIVRADDLLSVIRDDTALVSLMYANNEIGTVQPVSLFAKLCGNRGVLFHTDAVQAAGAVPIDVRNQFIDMLSLSAHKFHGPKGTGALFCRQGIPVTALAEGGAQEHGKRAGTENVPGIAGMAAALEQSCRNMNVNNAIIMSMRDRLIDALGGIEGSKLNGHEKHRLPGIVNFSFEGIQAEALLHLLDMAGICASAGSACASGSQDSSHVLLALGLTHEIAKSSLRLSLSAYNTPEEMEYIIQTLPPIIKRLRDMPPV